MSDKIKKITERIYEDGIAKAKTEAADIIAKAKKDAEAILSEAKKKEEQILKDAEKKATSISEKTYAETQMASKKAISKVKQEITNIVLTKQLSAPLEKTFSNSDFLGELIITLAKNWKPENSSENQLQVLLPEKEIADIKKTLLAKGVDELNGGLTILEDSGVNNGFKIGPENGNYVLHFTDKEFEQFFKSFLREETGKMLFEESKED